MRFWQQPAWCAVLVLGLCSTATANMAFNGTLVEPPPCTINNGSTIEIDFKDVGVNKVDGVNYRERVNYSITCTGGTLPWQMVLTVKGVATPFETSAVQSSVADLGIRILQNGIPFTLNTPLLITPSTPPVLEAVPVKNVGAVLGPGGFAAAATLLAEYQ